MAYYRLFGAVPRARCLGSNGEIAGLRNFLRDIILAAAPTSSKKVEYPLALTVIRAATVRRWALVFAGSSRSLHNVQRQLNRKFLGASK